MTIEQIFDTMAVRLKSENVGGVNLKINWTFTDMQGTPDEKWVLGLSHRTLHSFSGRHDQAAEATITMTRKLLISIVAQESTFLEEISTGGIVIDGDAQALLTVFGNFDVFDTGFAIVEP
jgi:alkyl sulfatase BDS1-like metallo-beta-lactamase superfamily hydrolase